MEDWPLILYNVDVQVLGPSSWVQIRFLFHLWIITTCGLQIFFYVEKYTYEKAVL